VDECLEIGLWEAIATYRIGRICATSGCRTYLSRYNPTSRCSLHR
jgi:hypothetical protein